MRGAVSGGMVLGLHELGLARAFHAAYGSSAGALNAMWLVSGRAPQGVPTWSDPALVRALIRRRRLLHGGPIVDTTTLVERRYEQLSPGLFDAVLASPTELHPIATDVASGQAVDLHATSSTSARCGSPCAPPPPCRCSPARPSASTGDGCSTRGSPQPSRSGPRSPMARRTCSSCAPGAKGRPLRPCAARARH